MERPSSARKAGVAVTVPIVVLAGSDRTAGALPPEGRDKHALTGYKGVDVRIGGRPLAAALIDRLRGSGAFGPVYYAGPAATWSRLGTASVLVDTNGSFGTNVHAGLTAARAAHPGSPVAITTCDILPEVETLRAGMEAFHRDRPCDIWFPLIRVPAGRAGLGASSWKPTYRLRQGGEPVEILPGHLVVFDPEVIRLDFVCSLLDLGYRTRNQTIDARAFIIIRGLLREFLGQERRRVGSRRLPTFTWDVMGAGIPAALGLRRGDMEIERLENAVRCIFVSALHRRRHPRRRVLFPVIDGLSLALDIDTEEEARERGAELTTRSA
jgi:hypothetical protein